MTMKDYTAHIPPKEKLFRAGIHIPVGLFNVFCVYVGLYFALKHDMPLLVFVGIVFAILFALGFFIYELNEDWHLKDNAWLDIYGWIIGFGIGVSLLFILSKLGVA